MMPALSLHAHQCFIHETGIISTVSTAGGCWEICDVTSLANIIHRKLVKTLVRTAVYCVSNVTELKLFSKVLVSEVLLCDCI